jgi:adenosylcobinamide kinase/adenosylcobinamide-phosphate guanylyltransferase
VDLILGGCKSGKSSKALSLAQSSSAEAKVYLATCQPRDEEMQDRIRRHQQERGPEWLTIEEPLRIAEVIADRGRKGRLLLVDCLTMWLSNLLSEDPDQSAIRARFDELAQSLGRAQGEIILVANEVGLGIVPENPLARRFRDEAGLLNQRIGRIADRAVFMAGGFPVVLKGAL